MLASALTHVMDISMAYIQRQFQPIVEWRASAFGLNGALQTAN